MSWLVLLQNLQNLQNFEWHLSEREELSRWEEGADTAFAFDTVKSIDTHRLQVFSLRIAWRTVTESTVDCYMIGVMTGVQSSVSEESKADV